MKHLLHSPSFISLTATPNKTKVLIGLAVCLFFSGMLITAFSTGAVGSPAHSTLSRLRLIRWLSMLRPSIVLRILSKP